MKSEALAIGPPHEHVHVHVPELDASRYSGMQFESVALFVYWLLAHNRNDGALELLTPFTRALQFTVHSSVEVEVKRETSQQVLD